MPCIILHSFSLVQQVEQETQRIQEASSIFQFNWIIALPYNENFWLLRAQAIKPAELKDAAIRNKNVVSYLI